MKTSEILKIESENRTSIFLIKEGLFFRAYEVSAMLFSQNIAAFHLTKRYFKIIDAELVYLGFPSANLPLILKKAGVEREYDYGKPVVELGNFSSDVPFEEWKNSIERESESARFSRELDVPDVDDSLKPKDLLHLYKAGFDLMVDIYRLSANFTREHKYTVGEQLKNDAFDVSISLYRMASDKRLGDMSHVKEMLQQIRLRLRLMVELKQLSLKNYSQINIKIEYLYRQVAA